MGGRHILLTGISGSGKTTVGRLLAASLGLAFVDLDEYIEHEAGTDVRTLFSRSGEAAFRRLEEEALCKVLERVDPLVVATGGGALAHAPNRRAAREAGCVLVWLRVSPAVAARRCAEDAATASLRPLLAGPDPAGALESLLRRREPAYSEADIRVDTDGVEPEQVTRMLVEEVASR